MDNVKRQRNPPMLLDAGLWDTRVGLSLPRCLFLSISLPFVPDYGASLCHHLHAQIQDLVCCSVY